LPLQQSNHLGGNGGKSGAPTAETGDDQKPPLGREDRRLGEDGDSVADGVAAVRLAVSVPGCTTAKRLLSLVPNTQRNGVPMAEPSELTSTGFHMDLSFL
jgi:hypothetical protein